MSFRTQRLANAFPLWTKIRRDPSSFGHRFLETFAEMGEEMTVMAMKIKEDPHLLKSYLGIGDLYAVLLDDDDAFRREQVGGSTYNWVYPTIVGTDQAGTWTLDRYEDVITLLNAPPDRIVVLDTSEYQLRPFTDVPVSYSGFSIWDSVSPYVFYSPERPERLWISVENSTFYSKRTSVTDREYSGKHEIQIVGTDENDIEIKEYIAVLDDGVYVTRNIFKTVVSVVVEGFDGRTKIWWFPNQLPYEPDLYHAAVFDDFEGQLRLYLTTQVVSATTYSYVEYKSTRLKLGEQYRRPGIEAASNVEDLAEVVLLDSSGNPYTAVDLAINHQTSRLYVLDNQGSVHVYDNELSPFSAFSLSDIQTSKSYIELVPLRHYAKYGNSEYLYTHFVRLRENIKKIEIKRRAPDGTIRYLQSDKSTWGAGQAYILATNPSATLAEDSWSDFRFATEYNQVGQWEYVVTTMSTVDTTSYTTAVQAGALTALVSLDTDIVSPTGIAFTKEDSLAVSTSSEVHYFQEVVDGWIADTSTGRALLRANYDSVEVSY